LNAYFFLSIPNIWSHVLRWAAIMIKGWKNCNRYND
jgi:hypothetical protein